MNRRKDLLLRLKKLLLQGIEMFQGNNMPVYSGYATLFIVTAVFPFIMLIISIVNLLPGYSASDVANILFQILPDLGPIKELIISMMADLKDQSGGLLASAAALTNINYFFYISSIVVMLFALLVILQIYAVLPDTRRTLKSQLPGALLSVVCWFVFTKLFSFFIPRFYKASSLYGSLASLFLLLLWLRFVVMILFAGAVLNRILEEEQQEDKDRN